MPQCLQCIHIYIYIHVQNVKNASVRFNIIQKNKTYVQIVYAWKAKQHIANVPYIDKKCGSYILCEWCLVVFSFTKGVNVRVWSGSGAPIVRDVMRSIGGYERYIKGLELYDKLGSIWGRTRHWKGSSYLKLINTLKTHFFQEHKLDQHFCFAV